MSRVTWLAQGRHRVGACCLAWSCHEAMRRVLTSSSVKSPGDGGRSHRAAQARGLLIRESEGMNLS